MKRSISPSMALGLLGICLSATAQTVTPLKGQSPELTQQDIAACQAQSGTTATASTDTPQAGGRARGAAAGAAAGAAVAGARGRQHEEVYDRMDDDTKQAYRQNQAKDAAAAGMVVGGSRQRQDRREDRATRSQQSANTSSAYAACMQQRGYQVGP
ncbi:YMGG-like glycine zipper-containing protein [Achromobacter insolitus]|uniref:YMGG-like glycine zipper-containing protein n=1 Tax=Achromobacter insolitus TaxID=217204 RepID=UPI0017481439|nr:YMGG-like glycine zipper-containing protein [Achromobacter insolitus]